VRDRNWIRFWYGDSNGVWDGNRDRMWYRDRYGTRDAHWVGSRYRHRDRMRYGYWIRFRDCHCVRLGHGNRDVTI
jgi:hypothetical protein